MNLDRIVPLAVAIVGAATFVAWLSRGTDLTVDARVPGTDRVLSATGAGAGPGAEAGPSAGAAAAASSLRRFDGVPADLPGSWPGFRGAARDGIVRGEAGLLRTWPADGPRVLWTVEVGEGYAGPAVLAGRVVLVDYDRELQSDAIRCLSLADGQEIWRYSYPVTVKRFHGMSRTVPALTPSRVVAMGPKCHVTCLDLESGELRWQLDLVRDFGTKVPPWYAGQCPLIEGDRVILAPGGEDLLVAVDLETGKVAWRSGNPRRWAMTHSSVLPIEVGGRRQYVYCASGGVAGVSAEDGKLLWDTEEWQISIATVPTPVDLGGGALFFSGGYEAGSLFGRIVEEGGAFAFRAGKRLPQETFGSIQQTPVLEGGHLYGVRPDGELVCLDPEGSVKWTSGPANVFGLGPYTVADGLIYALEDHGLLVLARATPERYEELARGRAIDGKECWGPMALVGGRLLIRDYTRLRCLDVKGG